MTIRQRISLLIALVFAALALVGGYAVVQARQSAARVRSVTEGVVPSAMESMALMARLKDVQIATLDMVAADDTGTVEEARKALTARKAELQSALAAQLAGADSPAQRGLIKEAQESLQNYFDSIEETARFKLAGRKDLAQVNMAGNVDQYLREQGEVMRTLQVEKNRSKDAAIASLNADMGRTQATLSVVTTGAVLLLCGIGFMLYRQIVRPVGEMQLKMSEIATSQDFTLRVPVNRMDEIGKSMTAFNAMVEKIQQSSEVIRQKTADIHSMMHAIPQGILTLHGQGRIHPEYSDFLETILEQDDLTDRNVMDVVFGDAGLGGDELSQIATALAACIGEDEMNFEFNLHLLPLEIEKTFSGGRVKVLDLNWSAMTDASGTITRLLLCVRDVTELRELARAADAQKRELAIIGEILGVTHEKFHEFVDSAGGFFDRNAALIAAAAHASAADRASAVGVLLRNMHTIKGNARTHGLVHLTNAVHEIEETYDHLRTDITGWNTDRLVAELAQGRLVLDGYGQINELKLGRRGPGRRGAVDKFVMVPKQQLERLLNDLERIQPHSVDGAGPVLESAIATLHAIGAERIDEVLSGVLDSLPSLATELDKSTPVSIIHDHGILVRSQVSGMLRDAFMHLYRNALDHGIESRSERLEAGKPAAGRIDLSLGLDDRRLRLVLEDDGRGLSLARLRARAIASGLVDETEALEPVDIANLIFAPGFSTADGVTQVSGRGVGMDAVRGFVQAEGGEIMLELKPTLPGQEATPFRIVIALPAKFACRPLPRPAAQLSAV
jgi:two-component system, chemotaxis family, sensor kinase CheA